MNIRAGSFAVSPSTPANFSGPAPSCENFHPERCERKARENQHERLVSNKHTKTIQNFSSQNRSEQFWAVIQQHREQISPEKKHATPKPYPNAQPSKHLESSRGHLALCNSPSLRQQADSHDKQEMFGAKPVN